MNTLCALIASRIRAFEERYGVGPPVQVQVAGYYRRDGRYVRSYVRGPRRVAIMITVEEDGVDE